MWIYLFIYLALSHQPPVSFDHDDDGDVKAMIVMMTTIIMMTKMIAAKSTTAFDKIHLLQVEWDTADLDAELWWLFYNESCMMKFTHLSNKSPSRHNVNILSTICLVFLCFCVCLRECSRVYVCVSIILYVCLCMCMLLCVPEVVCVSLVCWFKWPSLSAVYNSLWECVFSTNHFPLYLLLIIIKDSNFSLHFLFISNVESLLH